MSILLRCTIDTVPKKTRSHHDANGLKLNPQMSPHFQ